MSAPDQREGSGQLLAAISNAVVRIVHEYRAAGPRRPARRSATMWWSACCRSRCSKPSAASWTTIRRGLVVEMRRSFQQTMREDLSAAVEMLTERKVIAFMSDSQLEPDYSVEVFVLEPVI